MFAVATNEAASCFPEAPILIPDGPWKQVRAVGLLSVCLKICWLL